MAGQSTVAGVLSRGFGVLVLLVVLSGSAGVAASVSQHRSARDLTEHVLPLRLANAELRAVLGDAQTGLRGYLLTGDARFLARVEEARSAYPGAEQNLRRLVRGPQRAAVEEQARRARAWWQLAEQQRRSPPRSDQAASFVEQGRARFDTFLAANDTLDTALSARGDRLVAESRSLRTLTTVALAVLTVLAGLLAAVTARRTTRVITGPLRRLGTVLDRLGSGDADARFVVAPTDPVEVRRVAGMVNTMADEAERARVEQQDSARLRAAARALGIRIRQHLAVDTVLREAVDGLGEMLDAEQVVARLPGAGSDRPVTLGWSRAPAGPDPAATLGGLGWDWLEAAGGTWSTDDVRSPGRYPPPAERAALQAAGAGPVLTVATGTPGDHFGAVTLIRAVGRPPWGADAVRVAESVAADLGRGVRQARMYEQEQQLVLRLRDLDTAKTDFMSTVSHELRTPLTSIAGYVEMLQDQDAGPITNDQAKMLDVIHRNTRRLRALIGDLLILSRIEAGTFKTQRKTVELAGLVTAACAAVEPAAAKSGVSVRVDVEEPLQVPADAEQLDRVLANLLSNAVKFTPAGGVVEVRGRREGDEAVLTVTDSGMGIPAAEQEHLFARFFRASNAVRLAVPGTGLGLAIVHTIVQNHGGDIRCSSREGEGTTFTVRLPGG